MHLQILNFLSPLVADMNPAETAATYQYLAAFQAARGTPAPAGAGPVNISPDDSDPDRPNTELAHKGQRLARNWADVALRVLGAGPRGHGNLSAAVKAEKGTCLPGYALAYLMHFLWSRGDVVRETASIKGRRVKVWALAAATPGRVKDASINQTARRVVPRSPDEWVAWIAEQLDSYPDGAAYDAELVARANREFGQGTVRNFEMRWNDAADKACTVKSLVPYRGDTVAVYYFAGAELPPLRDMLPHDPVPRIAPLHVEDDTD